MCFLGSRRWLDEDHEWRWDTEAFDGIEEHNLKPPERFGEWILERLNQHWFRYLSTSKDVTRLQRVRVVHFQGRFTESFGKFSLEVVLAGLTSGFRVKFGTSLDTTC
ncbi:hypothetical protein ACLB2K_031907 [Fragaria x ananassa]